MEYVDWIHMTQGRAQWQALVNTVMNFRVLWKSADYFTRRMTIGFSRSLLHGVTRVCCYISLYICGHMVGVKPTETF